MRKFSFLAVLALAAWAPLAVQAAIQSERVTYRDGDEELRGYLTWDDAVQGRRPGVLVAHEWWGLDDYVRNRAEAFAKLGYVAFALDLYGEGRTTDHPDETGAWSKEIQSNTELWQRRARAGLEVLRKHRLADARRIAAAGYCFGGGTVMQLAYGGADLRAVVSFHGPLPPPSPAQAKAIKGAIFAAHGSQDAFAPHERVQAFQTALDGAGVDWFMMVFGNARHSFTNPGADARGLDNLKYDEKADKRSWAAATRFLEERLGGC
ncbi:MAG: dienelactone hydrolase family protein [Thiohalomonadaceae bacterium]